LNASAHLSVRNLLIGSKLCSGIYSATVHKHDLHGAAATRGVMGAALFPADLADAVFNGR
jgi:hypothetical protein